MAEGRLDLTYAGTYALPRKTVTATEARKNLYRLLDEVAITSEPIQITGKRASAVILAEADWPALEETVRLVKLVGDLTGAYSRRINIQRRLVYQVPEKERVVKVLRLWTHYE